MDATDRANAAYGSRRVIPVVGFALAVVLVWLPAADGGWKVRIATEFRESIRQELFSSMIAVASFLLATKTLVLTEMMRRVQSESYRERWQGRLSNGLVAGELMDPVRRASTFLTWTIVAAVTAGSMQFSIGFLDGWWPVAVCLAGAASALGLLVSAVVLLQANVSLLIDWAETNKD